jgi:hypothetical protein
MTGPINGSAAKDALDLPAFSLDVQALDLGEDVKAVGLEILETESREPVRGKQATEFWAAVVPLLTADEAGSRCIVIPQPAPEQLQQLFERFEAETFGLRSGARAKEEDALLTSELSHRGLDAYQDAYRRYTFCAVCEFEDGWVTLLSETVWASEVIRRVRPAAQSFDVFIARPQ